MKRLLKNANILTMKDNQILYRTDLLIRDNEILAIGKDLPSENGDVMDLTGHYLMPGLFDAHVHYNTSEMGPLFLANGITGVRNMQGVSRHLEYGAEILAGKRIGPYIYSTGQLYDGKQTWQSLKVISSEEEAEKAVYDTAEGGFQWVKTYTAIADNVYLHLMKTAQKAGIKVCGHMSYTLDSKVLADLGYHCVEHSSSLPKHPADIEYIARSGMWFCPTQVVCETLPDYVWDGKRLCGIPYYDYVPQVNRSYWEEHNKGIIEGYKNRGIKPDINVIIERGRVFMKHSARILAGSDCAYPGLVAGFSLHDELSRLVKLYGMTPYEALRAATVNPAEHVGEEDRKGRLRPGMDADILILKGNPLADIDNTRSIHGVIQGGRLFDRTALDSLLEGVKALGEAEIEILLR